MRVLVTGANGFLGSWICRVLSEEFQVVGVIRPGAKQRNLEGVCNIEIQQFEESSFNKSLSKVSPDVVVLCDWWGVGNQLRNDDLQFTNVERIRNRIPALSDVPTVFGVGSQAELGPKSTLICENELDAPTTKYGLAKVEARRALESKLDSHVRLIWGRVFSTYGPLDSESWFIPSTIRKLLSNQKVALTQGEQEWSFLHAYDLGQAFKSLIENKSIDGVVNIGNPKTNTILEVSQIIGNYLNRRELLDFGSIPYREDQVMRLAPKTEKLSRIGWVPKIGIHDGINHLIGWMSGGNSINLKTTDGRSLALAIPDYL